MTANSQFRTSSTLVHVDGRGAESVDATRSFRHDLTAAVRVLTERWQLAVWTLVIVLGIEGPGHEGDAGRQVSRWHHS